MNKLRKEYNIKANNIFLLALTAHLPILSFMAYYFGTEQVVAWGLGSLVIFLAFVVTRLSPGSVQAATAVSLAAILISALMIHLGKGMIEFHFHIFCVFTALPILGYTAPILITAVAGILHHLILFYVLPSSLFNYDASLAVVFLHAAFVGLEVSIAVPIARWFDRFLTMQVTSLGPLNSAAKIVTKSGSELQDMMQELHKVSSAQTSSTTETTSSMQEISAMAKQNEESISESTKEVETTVNLAQDGKKAVVEMMDDIRGIEQSNQKLNQTSTQITENLERIFETFTHITSHAQVINDIVFQTRLLSFNASVEAARAGEAGKGFAVVAEEIENLATGSGKAAGEISTMLTQGTKELEDIIGKTTKQIEAVVSENDQNVRVGSEKASQVDSFFTKIESNVSQLQGVMAGVLDAIRQQTSGFGNILTSTEELEKYNNTLRSISHRIEVLSNEVDSNSTELKQIVDNINQILGSESPQSSLQPDRQKQKPQQGEGRLPLSKVA